MPSDGDVSGTVDITLISKRSNTNESQLSLSPINTKSRSRPRRDSILELLNKDDEMKERIRHVFDSIAITMKRLRQRRARVYLEKTRVEEQASFGKIKRDDVASIHADLKLEFQLNPPGSAGFNPEKAQELMISLGTAHSQAQQAEKTLDSMNTTLAKQERRLQEAEDRILNHIIGESSFTADDLFDADFDQSSTGSISPTTAHSPQIVDMEEFQIDRDASEIAWSPSGYNSRTYDDGDGDDYEHRTMMSQSTRHDYISTSVPHSPMLNFGEQTGEQGSQARRNSEVDSDTSCVGGQFQRDQSEIEQVKEDSLSEMEADAHMRQKRKHDPVVVLTAQDDLEPISSRGIYDAERQSLGNLISQWIVQLFASSWLELSRFVPLVSKEFPVIETIVMTIGYINLDILVRESWTFDDSDVESKQMRSIIPSVASVSDDLPSHFQHIYIGSDKGPQNIRLSQEPRIYGRHPDRLEDITRYGSIRTTLPSITHSPTGRLLQVSKERTLPATRVAAVEDGSIAFNGESDGDFFAGSDQELYDEPTNDTYVESDNQIHIEPVNDVYIEPLDLNEQYYKT